VDIVFKFAGFALRILRLLVYSAATICLRVAGINRFYFPMSGLLGRQDDFSSPVAFDQPNEHWSEF
jgi:hypothetical protein